MLTATEQSTLLIQPHNHRHQSEVSNFGPYSIFNTWLESNEFTTQTPFFSF